MLLVLIVLSIQSVTYAKISTVSENVEPLVKLNEFIYVREERNYHVDNVPSRIYVTRPGSSGYMYAGYIDKVKQSPPSSSGRVDVIYEGIIYLMPK